ncbi:ATP-binding protein [Pseudomonas benzenivorans]|uniref:histidine kinase n=1 Tax=Pseudomonas benzenivorans TaxID=556533 RepID=A0ABY5H636_9PSED|nr:ATP-binding protein [Pseudomonas benzenivorans]UTW07705.1 PAS domain-containing protein [Pseudomonas benzenivorans]
MDSRQSYLASVLVEHVGVGVIILDSQLRIQYWNAFISHCSGKALEQARNQLLTSVFPEASTPHLDGMVAQARDHGQHVYTQWRDNPYLIKLPFKPSREPGALMLQSTLLFPFRDMEEQLCFGLLLYDTTEFARANAQLDAALDALSSKQIEQERLIKKLEKANAQLLQSEKLAAIGQLAAGVAHEINNPIGYVFSNLKTLAGYVQDLLRISDAVDGAASLEEIRQLKRSLEYDYIRSDIEALIGESEDGIDRVKKIITALKDFSHIEEDEFQLADLHRGLDTTLNVVNNELKYKAEVIKDYGELPEVECIPSQINQVLMNLLVNAAHAIEQFGRITLRSKQEGDWVWLEVEDTGKGIEPHLLNRIYEPFFTTKPVGKGTGLGLSLSYNILQKHNGRIEVSSQPGQGSRFRIWLPIRQPAEGSLGTTEP